MIPIPEFFKMMLQEQYGDNTVDTIIQGFNHQKPVTLRVNTIKSTKDEVMQELRKEKITFREVGWYQDALIIENAREEQIQRLNLYEQGKIYLQSLSSMLPPILLDPKPKQNILDMAAAPGGKTTQIAALSYNKAFITACERNKIRGEKLKYNLQKQGIGSVNVMLEDARNLSDFFSFDKILLDAPCSGSGTENVFKKNFTKELIQKSSKTQEVLLKKALKILKPGGEMIYSTCSILQDENEKILEKALKNSHAKLIPIKLPKEIACLPSSLKEVAVVAPNRLFEGFFIAKIGKFL